MFWIHLELGPAPPRRERGREAGGTRPAPGRRRVPLPQPTTTPVAMPEDATNATKATTGDDAAGDDECEARPGPFFHARD